MKATISDSLVRTSNEELSPNDTSASQTKRLKKYSTLCKNLQNYSQVVVKSKSTIPHFHKTLFFPTNTVTHWIILTIWPFGKHSLVISLTLLKLLSILSWPTAKINGWGKTLWLLFCPMAMMAQDLNIAAAELKDFCNWPILMARSLTKNYQPTSQSLSAWTLMNFGKTFNPQISHSFSPQGLQICFTHWDVRWKGILESLW